MSGFLNMTAAEIDAVVMARLADLDAHGLSAGDVARALEAGDAEIVRSEHGFAIVQTRDKISWHLWLLYVDPDRRGLGVGRRLVRTALRWYARDCHMTLLCHGSRRSRFFSRLGFFVWNRDGEWRHMSTGRRR